MVPTAYWATNSQQRQILGAVMKYVLVLLLVLVVVSLFSGLFFMYRNRGNPKRMVNALKFRVAFSIAAFLIAVGGFVFGWFPRS